MSLSFSPRSNSSDSVEEGNSGSMFALKWILDMLEAKAKAGSAGHKTTDSGQG